MADLFIVRERLKFSAMLSAVCTLLGGLATWHFWKQLEFDYENSRFLLSAVITAALALATVGLAVFYLAAQRMMNPTKSFTDRIDTFPWWIVKISLLILVIAVAGFFVYRYGDMGEDEFDLLRLGNLETLEERIQSSPRLLTATNVEGLTLIQEAYQDNNTEAVRLLLDLGSSTDHIDPLGRNPVLASLENLPMLEVLLDGGLNPSVKDADGIPAVHHAARRETPGLLDLLLDAGADVDERNGIYRTALMQSLENGMLLMTEILIARGADLNAFDQRGDTPLHIAVRRRDINGVQMLLGNGADPTIFNFTHLTPLHSAAQAGHSDVLALFFEYVDSVSLLDEADFTPFDLALGNRNYDTAKLLVDHGADINRIMTDGKTILHRAINRREYEVARFLIRAGAQTDIPDKDGRTVIGICKVKELHGLIEMIEGPASTNEVQAVEN